MSSGRGNSWVQMDLGKEEELDISKFQVVGGGRGGGGGGGGRGGERGRGGGRRRKGGGRRGRRGGRKTNSKKMIMTFQNLSKLVTAVHTKRLTRYL